MKVAFHAEVLPVTPSLSARIWAVVVPNTRDSFGAPFERFIKAAVSLPSMNRTAAPTSRRDEGHRSPVLVAGSGAVIAAAG